MTRLGPVISSLDGEISVDLGVVTAQELGLRYRDAEGLL
jgi:hypothetical protein